MTNTTKTSIILGALLFVAVFGLFTANPMQAKASTVCSDGTCYFVTCNTNADCGTNTFVGYQSCQGNNVYESYRTHTCNNPGTAQATCTVSESPQLVQACNSNQTCSFGACVGNNPNSTNNNNNGANSNCTQDAYQQCSGNSVYWYDSCGNQEGVSQTCSYSQTCQNNTCVNQTQNNQPQNNYCNPDATRQCVGNVSYWYDSCGVLQTVYENCGAQGQICQSGQCISQTPAYQPPAYNPAPAAPSVIKYYAKSCYNNNVYWYNSNGIMQGIYQNCTDANSCTVDTCATSKCVNTLKCDGSTCAVGSQDYNTYCQNQNPTAQGQVGGLAVSLFEKKDSDPQDQWVKSINAANGDDVDFLITIKNTSGTQVNDATVKVDFQNSIAYNNDLKVNNFLSAGDVVSGVDVGAISPMTSKILVFSGSIEAQSNQTSQITATITSGAMSDSEVTTINESVNPSSQTTAPAATVTPKTSTAALQNSGLAGFLEKWYLWIIIIIVLMVLFVVIFRKLGASE